MKVAYFTALRELQICDVPKPTLNGHDQVLLQIDRVGICGSDVHYYTEGGIGHTRLTYPATLGHECSGTVVTVGSAVNRLKPGDRVAVEPAMVCGTCDQCRMGRINTCRHIQFMGLPGQALGAVAEYRVMPAANCYPIPDSLSLDDAALAEPLSIGLYAVRLCGIAPGMKIGIFGAGPIGLSVLLCAKAAAPCTVYITDLLEERLAAARECGADWTGNPKTADIETTIAAAEPLGLDVVFECSGDPACIDLAERLLAPGGTLGLVGIPAAMHVSFDVHLARTKELTFKSVRRQKDCVEPVIDWMAAGKINARPLLTHRFPLDRIRDGFELVARYGDGVIKAMVDVAPVAE